MALISQRHQESQAALRSGIGAEDSSRSHDLGSLIASWYRSLPHELGRNGNYVDRCSTGARFAHQQYQRNPLKFDEQ